MSADGVISGTPDTVGIFTVSVTVTGSDSNRNSKNFNLIINPAAFTDVLGHWAKDAVLWATGIGIKNGYPDGNQFRVVIGL